MFGGLHIEKESLKVLGDLLEGSNWTGAFVPAGVAASGTAYSFLKPSHVTRKRRAHHVTTRSLYLLRQSAYRSTTRPWKIHVKWSRDGSFNLGSTEKRQDTDRRHHEQKRHAQMSFAQDLRSLNQAMEEMRNPFAEYSSYLLVLKGRDVDTAVADTVLQMEKVGLEQYETC
ncbi:hypothetical protein HOLleu_16850 [Holothuria leucospilota]|uniref:Uncharacterized protein n=1 Tax=Holothuria leucospilota TaxID=206669 RepID=A0A9Q1HBB4_HOLLE|nr:hypothetical protein HOLleu_16850 [Holothuria leucospilota]